MQGYRIDPVSRTVTPVEYSGDYKQIYGLLSDENFDIDTFDVVRLCSNGDVAFVDDEGLLKPCDHFWKHDNYAGFLAGPGLFLGTNMDDGETIEAQTSIEEVRSAITFYTRAEVLAELDKQPVPF